MKINYAVVLYLVATTMSLKSGHATKEQNEIPVRSPKPLFMISIGSDADPTL
jgi:hypothetical protein